MLGLGVKGCVDRDDIADPHHVFHTRMPGKIELLFHRFRQAVTVEVMEVHVEWFQPTQHGKTNTSRRDRADVHTFHVIRTRHTIGDVPAPLYHPLVGRDVVAHEAKNHHDDVFGDADRVAISDFYDSYSALTRRLQVDMVRTDAGSDCKLEVLRLGYALSGEIGRPERL